MECFVHPSASTCPRARLCFPLQVLDRSATTPEPQNRIDTFIKNSGLPPDLVDQSGTQVPFIGSVGALL